MKVNPPEIGSFWFHVKSGGVYCVLLIGRIEKTMEPAVIYKGATSDQTVWVRPLREFMDGRFTPYVVNTGNV